MRVAFVHYHVKSGGVTRVMENAVSALSSAVVGFDGVVLCGHQIPDNCLLPARIVEGLGYMDEAGKVDPKILADRMEASAKTFFGAKPDIWHIHNHSLGKNPSMVDAVVELANRGNRIVLQVHDFAEDGRPINYRLRQNHTEVPSSYPISKHIHYVVLNRRDYDILKESGIREDNITWLPNPVVIPRLEYDNSETYTHAMDELIVYPVRAVRRKNLGELLLHSVLASKRKSFVTTLGTTSGDFIDEYETWKDFAMELGLHVNFGVCQNMGLSFDSLIDQSTCIISTSVAEGFGLGFVEPWVFGKSLIGRDLPEITNDFREIGVEMNQLYRSIDVPVSIFRFDEFRSRLSKMIKDYHQRYGIDFEQHWLDQWVETSVHNQMVDFAKLDEIAQREIIESVQSSPQLQSNVHEQINCSPVDSSIIDHNASVVERELSIAKYGERLKTIYEKLMDSELGTTLEYADGDSILSSFFSVERFLPLRS